MMLYADMVGGAGGDMIVGAMIDAGLPLEMLQAELDKLKIPGLKISAESVERQGVRCVKFHAEAGPKPPHRTFADIQRLIEEAGLSTLTKERSLAIFRRLAEAESSVHCISPEEVHFHEVGATDSIADIAGAAVGMEFFQAEGFYLSEFLFGGGTVHCSHGILPLPAPATVLLTQGFAFRRLPLEGELTTPTAAAILTAFSRGQIPALSFIHRAVGCGAGTLEFPGLPPYFRLWVLDTPETEALPEIVIEANIDDMNPELHPYLMETLFQAGAKDVFFTLVVMKKGRPGVLVTITAEQASLKTLGEILFRESTTIGLRWYPVNRWKLPRGTAQVETAWGKLTVKTTRFGGKTHIHPEYEACRALAEQAGVSISEVYRAVISAGEKT